MALHDVSYQHWTGVHQNVWRRRWAIAQNGIAACLRLRLMRQVLLASWGAALAMTAILFMVGQLLVADSIIVQWTGIFSPQGQNFVHMLTTWLEQHPEISVHTTQDLLFYCLCTVLMWTSIFAVGMSIPVLITRDLGSNAIIIYSSKAINRMDYLFGKFATAFGLMTLTWLGPVCVTWFVGNLLAPDWRFFWHSRAALFNAVTYSVCGMTVLSLIALGVSAISPKEKSTVSLWYLWWVLGRVVAIIAAHTHSWVWHLSFGSNLNQLALGIFQLGHDVAKAQDNIPVFGRQVFSLPPEAMSALGSPAVGASVFALLLMMGAAAFIIRQRVKPE